MDDAIKKLIGEEILQKKVPTSLLNVSIGGRWLSVDTNELAKQALLIKILRPAAVALRKESRLSLVDILNGASKVSLPAAEDFEDVYMSQYTKAQNIIRSIAKHILEIAVSAYLNDPLHHSSELNRFVGYKKEVDPEADTDIDPEDSAKDLVSTILSKEVQCCARILSGEISGPQLG